jgi:hypothetical protein
LIVLRPLQVGLLLAMACLAAWNGWQAFRSSHRRGGSFAAGSMVVLTFLIAYKAVILAAVVSKGQIAETRYFVVVLPVVMALLTAWATAGPPGASSERPASRPRLVRGAGVIVCLVFCAAQVTATIRWSAAPVPEGYVVTTRDSPVIPWLREHTSPDEMLLATAGAEIAMYRPNPILRTPRRPHSARQTTSWADVDDLARRTGARYLIHWKNPEDYPLDPESSRFRKTLDQPEQFPERSPVTLGDHVIYRVGADLAAPGSS